MKNLFLTSMAVVALATGAAADTLTATITPTINLTHATLAFALDASSIFGAGTYGYNYISLYSAPKDTMLAGVPTTITQSFTNVFSLPVAYYTVFATYDDGSVYGGSVALNTASASSLISLSTPWPFSVSEPWYEASFNNNNADTWDSVFHEMIYRGWAAVPGDDAGVVNFSNATNGGTITDVSFRGIIKNPPVPAPAAVIVFVSGALLRRRRA